MILTGCLLVSVMLQPPFKYFKIEKCMGDMNLSDCIIYLDNIVAFSSTFEEHLEKLEAVFLRLQINNMKLKASKYEFLNGSAHTWDMLSLSKKSALVLLK